MAPQAQRLPVLPRLLFLGCAAILCCQSQQPPGPAAAAVHHQANQLLQADRAREAEAVYAAALGASPSGGAFP